MAHYAFLDENNIVTEVIVGVNEDELIEGQNPEIWYSQFRGQRCVRTSYNTLGGQHSGNGTPFRKNYAGIGYSYSDDLDAFIAPKPFPSWLLDEDTCLWQAPIPYPGDAENVYTWNEQTQSWDLIQITIMEK